MPHKVSEQRQVIEAVKKIFSETMPERMGIDHLPVYPVKFRKMLQLLPHPSGCNSLTEPV